MLVFLVTNDYHSSMNNNNKVSQGGSNTMYKNLKSKNQGFTIIEVLIVLAIAGLIMLIVFLAVPALQRNSRNNARNSDGSRWVSAVTECLSNRNYDTASCDSVAELNLGTLNHITALGGPNMNAATITFNQQCNAAGSDNGGAGTSTRNFTIRYELEPGGAVNRRCLNG